MIGVIISSPVHEVTIVRSESDPRILLILVTCDGHSIELPSVPIPIEDLKLLLKVMESEV